MRTTMGFNISSGAVAAGAVQPQQQQQQQHSPWHSPVPYLFGGLAAMLGLIAFALLILACSYWKLSGYLEGGESDSGDLENGDGKLGEGSAAKAAPVFEEKIVVIMAGDDKPTFLATPMSSRASSFGDKEKNKAVDVNNDGGMKKGAEEEEEEAVEGGSEGCGSEMAAPDQNMEEKIYQNKNQSQEES